MIADKEKADARVERAVKQTFDFIHKQALDAVYRPDGTARPREEAERLLANRNGREAA